MPNKALLQSLGCPYELPTVSQYVIGPVYKEPSHLRERKHCEMLSSFIDRLKEKKDAKGRSVFDSTIVSFGSTLRWARYAEPPADPRWGCLQAPHARRACGAAQGEHAALQRVPDVVAGDWRHG